MMDTDGERICLEDAIEKVSAVCAICDAECRFVITGGALAVECPYCKRAVILKFLEGEE